MQAGIDVGSNTLRMLISYPDACGVRQFEYRQKITRLGGNYSPVDGLSGSSMERTLEAFSEFAKILRERPVTQLKAVGTAALRRAHNSRQLIDQVKKHTGINLEIITGAQEARLTAAGVLSVCTPCQDEILIVDIGGGSTEFIFYADKRIQYSQSYPVGVVRVCEETAAGGERQQLFADLLRQLSTDLRDAGVSSQQLARCLLVGTAGTVTSLAAMNLQMTSYDRNRINNHLLETAWLEQTHLFLSHLSISQREQLPGMEAGRGDLILPGLELVIALCRHFNQHSLRVVDAGLLEGLLLDF